MPKIVDHEARREEIATAVWRLARTQGLQGVTFRQVAAAAEVPVGVVQHYFGTKEQLLVWCLDRNSVRLAARIQKRLVAAGPDPAPADALRIVAHAFVPTDRVGREAMAVYHAFAAAAMTDASLRTGAAFANERVLREQLASLIAAALPPRRRATVDPDLEARHLVALVLGLSLGVLLERSTAREARAVLDAHLDRLVPLPAPDPTRVSVR